MRDQVTKARSGARVLVDQLALNGVDLVFGVPGESYLAVLDALHDTPQTRFVICRMESGAANMAEAYGKLTGRPGIVMVTRGPGATHGAIGLHTGFQDSTPMIMFIGQVGRDMREREAFQEVDYRRMFGQVAKWVAEIDDAARIPEFIARAFTVATSGRPGPVVLALPEDVLSDIVEVADAPPAHTNLAHTGADDIARLRELLATAERPFVMAGGGGFGPQAQADIMRFAEQNHLPIGAAFRRQDHVDCTHPCYAGDVGIGIAPALAARVRDADLIIAVGPRLGEMTTQGYTLIESPVPRQKLVHIHPDATEIGRVFQPALGIVASMGPACAALAAMAPLENPVWAEGTQAAHAAYRKHSTPMPNGAALDMGAVIAHLREVLPADAILANGAGNYTGWGHRYYRWRRYGTQLAPTSGAMGYGVPAAVAAAIMHPDRPVIGFAGDGCFMMGVHELATAAQYGAAPIIIVVDNGMYGTIRMHQEREFPARVYGTALANPDFAALARAFGAHAERIERTEDFAGAFARARAAGKLALLHLITDPNVITTATTLSAIRERAQAAQA